MEKNLQHVGVGVGVKNSAVLAHELEGLGFHIKGKFQLTLENLDEMDVYFCEYKDLILEVYELADEYDENALSPIDSVVIKNSELEYKEYKLSYGLSIINVDDGEDGLKHFNINASDVKRSVAYFEKLGFKKAGEYYGMGNILLKLKESKDSSLQVGAIKHIAMDTKTIYEDRKDFLAKGVAFENKAVIEYLPFWDKGVVYIMTKGPDEINMEFNEILT